MGIENSLAPSPAVAPGAHANRVEYRRGTVTEWYANGPGGCSRASRSWPRRGRAPAPRSPWSSQPFEAERATQYEMGAKATLLGGRLTSTVALYRITKRNILATDPANPLARLPLDEARSRGLELDLSGQLTDHWSVIGSYAYTDTRIAEDRFGLRGNRLPDVPLHSGSLWTWYRVGSGAFSRVDVGAGVFAAGLRQGDAQNSFQLPGYARADAAAAYHWQVGGLRLITRLNLLNLFDQRYFESSNITDLLTPIPRLGIIPGPPLTVLGSIQVTY